MKTLHLLWKIPLTKILLLLVLFNLSSQAQSIKRQSISCFGSTLIDNGSVVQQTVGQAYSTTAFYTKETSILQGFQQPSVFKIENISQSDIAKNLKLDIYPNPAAYLVTIESEKVIEHSTLSVTNMNGQLVLTKSMTQWQKQDIECETWANGTYLIIVSDKNHNHSTVKLIINK